MVRNKKETKSLEIPRVSESEWEVLRILWERGAISASQITASLKTKTGWSLGAVRTFLTRLINKGVVRILDDEPIFRYEPLYDRDTLVQAESRSFLDKYFGGTFHSLIAHYLDNEHLPPEEIQRLRKMLEEKVEDRGQKNLNS